MEARAQQNAGSPIQHVKDYLEATVKLAKLKAAEKSSEAITNTAAYSVAALLGVFVLLFGSITLAIGLGNLLGNSVWGFLIVTVLYAALAAVVVVAKNKLIKIPVLNMLLKKMFKEGKDHEGDKGYETIS